MPQAQRVKAAQRPSGLSLDAAAGYHDTLPFVGTRGADLPSGARAHASLSLLRRYGCCAYPVQLSRMLFTTAVTSPVAVMVRWVVLCSNRLSRSPWLTRFAVDRVDVTKGASSAAALKLLPPPPTA